MSQRRLKARTPSATFLHVAWITGYKLKFHKAAKDGSAKADCHPTQNHEDRVYGGVFEIAVAEAGELDRYEGVGYGYEKNRVEVFTDMGSEAVTTYLATAIDATLRPYTWYVHHVLVGAREVGLPEDYIASIEALLTIEDPDAGRATREASIYH